jgi:5-(carboxyamino)imidazole ribonucleotide mutase
MPEKPLVAVVMGSKSDWPECMSHCSKTLDTLGVPHEVRVLSAHRTPDELFAFMSDCERGGVEVFIAAAGGAAHLAGVVASKTFRPVLAVPIETKLAGGLDSLLSMVQMPGGVPVGTLAVGKAGAVNAALLAASIVGVREPKYRDAVAKFRGEQARAVLESGDPRKS